MRFQSPFRALIVLGAMLLSLNTSAQTCMDWRPETVTRSVGHAMAFDESRGYPVIFGGYTGSQFLNTTAEWDGNAWRIRKLATTPPARAGAMMAYDANRKVIVMFGGDNGTTHFNDTWEYNGITWAQKSIPGAKPPARTEGAMVFDRDRNVMVLFGGQTASLQYNDTWEFDGAAWTQRLIPGPDQRYGHVMVYDQAANRTLLHGGWTLFADNQTWSYDGAAWTQLTPATTPPRLYAHTASFDAYLGVMVMHGGINASFASSDETWAFNGTDWSLSSATTKPSARAFHAMAYDPAALRTIMYGAEGTDTWAWSGGVWVQIGTNGPGIRTHGALAFDTTRNVAVLFGGYNGNPMSDLWEWDGRTWTLRTNSGGPGARFAIPAEFDPIKNRTLVVAQDDNDATPGMRTWGWNGADWIVMDNNGGPSDRSSFAMALDPVRQRIVLFGGVSPTGAVNFGDTWEWDGFAWTQVSTTGPAPRWSHAMAYDPALGGVVLYGGTPGSPTLSDTWLWNGTTWTEIAGANQPGPRVGHTMVYHAARGRVVLFGGPFVNTLWELNGTTWQAISPPSTPPSGRWLSMMCYDPDAGQALLFGGSASGSPGWQNDLWALGSPVRVVHHPEDTEAAIGETATFTVAVDGVAGMSFRWRKNGVDIFNGTGVGGTATRTLSITPDDAGDYALYSCAVTGTCGTVVTDEAQLHPACLPDFNDDGELDILDLLEFIDAFSQCENQPAPCAPNGYDSDYNGDTLVDILDFLEYLDNFAAGCA